MNDFCDCEDWKSIKNNNSELFKYVPTYGWVLNWIELTKEKHHTQVHRYGVSIKFCPMCGKKLKTVE